MRERERESESERRRAEREGGRGRGLCFFWSRGETPRTPRGRLGWQAAGKAQGQSCEKPGSGTFREKEKLTGLAAPEASCNGHIRTASA